MSTDQPPAPEIRITGPATPEDVAAVVAVLAAAGDGHTEEAGGSRASTWASHAVAMRRPIDRGPGAWRASLRR